MFLSLAKGLVPNLYDMILYDQEPLKTLNLLDLPPAYIRGVSLNHVTVYRVGLNSNTVLKPAGWTCLDHNLIQTYSG